MEQTITAITVQKNNPKRVNIYLDGEYGFSLFPITSAKLRVGQTLNKDQITAIQNLDIKEKCLQLAIKLISYRKRSEREIKKIFENKGFPTEIILETILHLQNNGLIDDKHLAQAWIENRVIFRPRSRWVLQRELHRFGISEEIIQQALKDIDDEELAYQAAKKYSHKAGNKNTVEFKRRMVNFLSRRGFSYDVIRPVVEKMTTELFLEIDEEN